jgi:membrane associated rhomboid family serine protease
MRGEGRSHLGGMVDEPPRFARTERIFNAPAVAVALALSMPALFWLQLRLPGEGIDWALRPTAVLEGDGWQLITVMLLHGGWGHVAMNAIGALAFGAAVARMLPGLRGVGAFLAFYVVCGALAGLGYVAIHPDSGQALVGASGAVFGLIGAATRLLGGGGRVLPLRDRRVISASLAWMGLNAFVGLIGFAPGAEGASIAWEAHAAGFIAGLVLIGPWVRLYGPRIDSSADLGEPPV